MGQDAPARVNIGAIHDDTATADPDTTAIIDADDDRRISYGTLGVRVASVANALETLGVGRSDRVVLCYPNDARYLVAVLAVARVGAVPVPVNRELEREKIAYILDDCGASAVLLGSDDTVSNSLSSSLDDASDVDVVAVDVDSPALAVDDARVVSLARRADAADRTHEPAAVTAETPALQPYTSGTTGRPKGVVLTHGGVSWCTDAFVDHLDLSRTDRGLVVTPLYHKNAMTGVVKPMLAVGGSIVLLPEFDAEEVLAAIDRHEVTYMTGVPAVYKQLLGAPEPDRDETSSFQWASCGSAPVPKSLVDAFQNRFDADLLEVYGLTEGGPVVCHSPRDGPRKVGSAGPALPGVDTFVVDPDSGATLPDGETGELLVASPGLGSYHERPDANDANFVHRDGQRVLETGDLATKDADGYHSIVGRSDDMLIVGGENCYPADVENRLLEHEAVRDAAVVGVPHATKGEAPVAFVAVGESVSADDLKAFMLDTGPPFAHPRRVFIANELPLTGTGKIDRETLRERALDRIEGEL